MFTNNTQQINKILKKRHMCMQIGSFISVTKLQSFFKNNSKLLCMLHWFFILIDKKIYRLRNGFTYIWWILRLKFVLRIMETKESCKEWEIYIYHYQDKRKGSSRSLWTLMTKLSLVSERISGPGNCPFIWITCMCFEYQYKHKHDQTNTQEASRFINLGRKCTLWGMWTGVMLP